MTVFIIVAALLTLAALFFVVPPLLKDSSRASGVGRQAINLAIYRDQLAELERDLGNDVISPEQFEQGKLELERRLLEDVSGTGTEEEAPPVAGARAKRTAVVIVLLIPLLAVGGYLWLGMPAALSPESAAVAETAPAGMQGDMSQQINQMVARLEQRLKSAPDDADGWAMLGRSYLVLQRFDDARTALERAMALKDNDAQVLVDYADALAMTSGETLEGRPMTLIEQALQIDPDNEKGLWLAGTAAYERADYQGAMDYWKRLRALVPSDSEAAQAMDRNIAEAQSLVGGAAPGEARAAALQAGAGKGAAGAGAGKSIAGTVRLDASLRNRVSASDTVFIFARAPQGPPMPLAVKRARVDELPLQYTLDDSMAMNPAASISGFSEVEVVARISKSGNAMPQSGDLQGSSGRVKVGANDVEVTIDNVVQ